MRITELKVENIKRIQAVSITPGESFVQITGRNGQGKSSLLDSIAYVLGGKDIVCDRPVREGQESARIVCTLDDLVVTRTFTAGGGSTLKVTNGDGANCPSPQAVLDKLYGKLTFDPLAFSRMPAKQQAETLRVLVGLDFTQLNTDRKEIYDRRTAINAAVKSAKAQFEGLPHHSDVPEKEVSVADLMSKLSDAEDVNRAVSQRENDLAADERSLSLREADVALCERRLADAKRLRDEQLMAVDLRRKNLAEVQHVDVKPLRDMVAGADAVNRKVRDNLRRIEISKQIEAAEEESESLTERIAVLDEEKAQQLADAPYPVPGLTFDETGVVFNGIPFSQASASEQLRVSVAMGIAMNPKLRVLLIRDGSLLDANGLKLIAEMAETHGAQIWIEKVSEGEDVGIVIEDGMVSAGRQPAMQID